MILTENNYSKIMNKKVEQVFMNLAPMITGLYPNLQWIGGNNNDRFSLQAGIDKKKCRGHRLNLKC